MTSKVTVALVSDVHGNLPALEAALDEIDRLAPDLVVHLGDMVNGPASVEVFDLNESRRIAGVYGNHEDYVLRCFDADAPPEWRTERFSSAHWTRKQLGPERLAAISGWPVVLDPVPGLSIVHGSPTDFRDAIRPTTPDEHLRETYRDLPGPIIACGHTHHPNMRRLDDRLYVNVGSTGVMLEGEPRAGYAAVTVDGKKVDAELRSAPFDTTRVLEIARRDGYLSEGGGIAACFVHEMTTGESWGTPFVRWWTGTRPDATSVDAYRAFAAGRGVDPLV